MAREFKLLLVFGLWLVVALTARAETEAAQNVSTAPSTVNTPSAVSTAPSAVSTAPSVVSTAPSAVSTTTSEVSTAPSAVSTTTSEVSTPTSEVSTTTSEVSTPTSQAFTTTSKVTATTAAVTTKPPDPCNSKPCGRGSTCEPRVNQTFECFCLPGEIYSYVSKSCGNAKVFPGALDVPEIDYNETLMDKTSQYFRETSRKIIFLLSTVFKTADYLGAIVLDLSELLQTRRVASRETSKVRASVQIRFNKDSDITTKKVETAFDTAGIGISFTSSSLCSLDPCDEETTSCKSENGDFTCACKEDYIATDFSDRVCIVPCPNGQKLQGTKCVDCPFGYTGLNCKESWQLVLVIVASVLGALLLITIILLPIVALKCPKKSSKSNEYEDTGKSYVSHSTTKLPLVNSTSQAQPVNGSAMGNSGVPKIPRATTTSNWDSKTNLEMTPSNSRQNLISVDRNSRLYEDQDDMNPYAQSRSSSYVQARPQNNPYAQNRAQYNPYAQNQGQTNSYYNGRRLN